MEYVPLIVLCAAAFSLAAWLVSGTSGVLLSTLDRLARHLQPRSRVRFYGALLVLPAALAAMTLLACFLPLFGIGSDHCLSHVGHHLHLCMNHLEEAPGFVLALIAGASTYRFVAAGLEFVHGVRTGSRAASSLRAISDYDAGRWVFPANGKCAFTLGLVQPQIFVSRGLGQERPDVEESVFAHERVHQAGRDPLWRMMGAFVSFAHLPRVGSALHRRLATAQEMAADERAACTLPEGRLRMAEALLYMAKAGVSPAYALSFTSEEVTVRVQALLEDEGPRSPWWPRLLATVALLLPLLIFSSHEAIHHLLETVLGLLSHSGTSHP